MPWKRHERLLHAIDQSGQLDGISVQRVQSFQEPFTALAPVSRTGMESGIGQHHVPDTSHPIRSTSASLPAKLRVGRSHLSNQMDHEIERR